MRRRGGSRAEPGPVPAPGSPTGPTIDGAEAREVEQFLYREARLLDERRWDDWLLVWADDATYQVPTRSVPQPVPAARSWAVDDELTGATGTWWVDETKETMAFRVAKMHTGKAWAEDPPSRTRRFVTNVEVRAAGGGRYLVRSNLLLYRGRNRTDVELFAAARRDEVVRADGSLRFASRLVTLDATVLDAANLVLFL